MARSINTEINIKVYGGNFPTIFERVEKITREEEIESLNKQLKNLDREILFLQSQFNDLILKKAKLMHEIEEEKKNGK